MIRFLLKETKLLHAASLMVHSVKDSASRVQSGARSSYAEAQPVFAGTVKLAPPSARSARWAATIILALLTTVTAWADNVTVTSETTSWTDGNTYNVTSNVTIAERITVTGTVTLNLGAGATLTASKGIEVSEGNTLTIEGSGTLSATGQSSSDNTAGIGSTKVGTIIINSGNINATGGSNAAAIGGSKYNTNGGTIIINGGVVRATGGYYSTGIGGGHSGGWSGNYGVCGTITINGGQVYARGGTNGNGIGAGYNSKVMSGNITFGYSSFSDYIDVGSISNNTNTISFASGKSFVYNTTTTLATTDGFTGQKLIPACKITVADPLHGTLTTDKDIVIGNDADKTITLTVTPATGYNIGTVKYNDGSDHTISPVSDVYSFTAPTKDVTVSATFSPITRNVIFDGNGATSGTMSNMSITYDETEQALTANAFERTGYTFSGWNTQADGNGTPYAADATVSNLLADLTLYAQWTLNTCTLTEDAGVTSLVNTWQGKQVEVSFTRSGLTADSYSTMCLPFGFTKPDNCTFYAFQGIHFDETENAWVADVSETTTLNAHTPYIFKCDDTSATFSGTISNVAASYGDTELTAGAVNATVGTDLNWTFKGTYTALNWSSADPTEPTYGFSTYVPTATIAAGTFVRFVQGASLAPFRARLIYSGNDTHLKSRTRGAASELPQYIIVRIIGSNGDTTAIGTLDITTGELTTGDWYTLGGRKLSGKPTKKGLYINNGKKILIK